MEVAAVKWPAAWRLGGPLPAAERSELIGKGARKTCELTCCGVIIFKSLTKVLRDARLKTVTRRLLTLGPKGSVDV